MGNKRMIREGIKNFIYFMRTTAFESFEVLMGTLVLIGFIGSSLGLGYIGVYKNSSYYNSLPSDWATRTSIIKDYEDVKAAFDNQKWAIINAYNAQIKNIDTNGLKTERDFHGLVFKSDDFRNKISTLENNIYDNHENKNGYTFSDAEKAEISSLFNKLNSRVNEKMAKIKAFYDARVRSIYSALKNEQKVKFTSLAESYTDKSAQFNDKDFDSIGSLISKQLDKGEDSGVMLLIGILWLITTAMIIAFIREAVHLGKYDREYYREKHAQTH